MADKEYLDALAQSTTWYRDAAPRSLGEYDIVRELGSGGMGVVYEAQHRKRGTRVALKTLKVPLAGSLLAFKEEFRSLAELAHPNLLALGELVTDVDPPFFTMELIDGVSFTKYVAAGFDSNGTDWASCFDHGRLRNALIQTTEGLLALHAADKLHRDIKPNNVLVNRKGNVVLVDFGLAVDVDHDVFRNTLRDLAGTPYYMSPEQAAGKPLSFSSDWYNVGVMLFQAMTGRLPFPGNALEEVQRKKLDSQRPVPKDVAPNVPDDLNALCVAMLDPDPARRPSGEEILRRLRGHKVSPRAEPAWVGREDALEQCEQALDAVRQGRPTTLLISGRSGMGKTALVERFLTSLRAQGRCVVLRGRCYENESVPYKGFDAVVDALCGYLRRRSEAEAERLLPLDVASLCRLFPVLREVSVVRRADRDWEPIPDAQESRRRGFAALREMLGRLANFETLVMFIDDLQWGDGDTAALFQEIVRLPAAPRCLTIASFRSEEAAASECVRAVRERDQPEDHRQQFAAQVEIQIDSLTATEATTLARKLLGSRTPDADAHAMAIARESGGDPLFVKVLAQHLGEAGESTTDGGPQLSLHDVLWKQILKLPSQQRQAVEMLAVAGRPVSQEVLQAAARFSEDALLLIRNLRVRRMVRRVGHDDRAEVETYHDRIRETVMRQLDPQRVAEHAGRLAETLALLRTDADPEFMAALLSRAGQRREAGSYFVRAAEQAREKLAFNQAVNLYHQAIEALEPQGADELPLRAGLADALACSGRGAEAAAEFLRAAEVAGDDQQLHLRCQAAQRYLTSGHIDEGLVILDEVLQRVGMPRARTPLRGLISLAWHRLRLRGLQFEPASSSALDEKQRQWLDVSWSAAAGLSVVNPIRASVFVSRNLLLALRAGEPTYVIRASTAQVGHLAVSGRRSRNAVSRMFRAIRQAARAKGGPYARGMRELARGVAAHLHGRWQAAQKSCDRAVTYLLDRECRDVAWELDTARTFALWALMYMGDVAELTRRQPGLLRTAQEHDDLFALLNFGTSVMATVQLGGDQPQEVRRRLDEEKQLLSDRGFFVQHHNWLLARTSLELYEGRAAAAWETIAGAWRLYSKAFLTWVEQVRIDLLRMQTAAAVAFAAEARGESEMSAARKLLRRLRRERAPWAAAFWELLIAGFATIEADCERAVEHYSRAVAVLDEVDMHLHAAAARCRLGQLSNDEELTTAGQTAMRQLGIRNPLRMTPALAPGLFLD